MKKIINKKVIVGLSGGVDSSVALFLLKKAGFQPIGISLKFSVWPSKKNLCRENLCCTNRSFALAKKLCQKLKVPYHLVDCQKEFNKIVINYFTHELKAGRTPNPCIICNRKLRFPKLFQLAKKFGANYLATGHYLQLEKNKKSKKFALKPAIDSIKDQTYFLYPLKQNQLAKLIFPLGKITKDETKKIAGQEKIEYTQHESQDFCFVANQSLSEFLKTKLGQKPGLIYNSSGQVLGTHQGLHFYTLGQRKGLSLGKPYWVYKIDKKNNTLFVTDNLKNKSLYQKVIYLKNNNFISGQTPQKPINVYVKCRSQQKLVKAKISAIGNKIKVIFNQPQWAITPGQSCVFYDKKYCLGGGIID